MLERRRMRSSAATRAGIPAALLRAAPWVTVLLLTGGFHVLRGASVDAVIFLGVGVLLAADAALGPLALGPLEPGTHERGTHDAGTLDAGTHDAGALDARTLTPRAIDSGSGITQPPAGPIVACGVLLGVVVALAPRYSPVDAAAVAALGLLLVPVVWPEPRHARIDALPAPSPRPPALRHAGALWSALAVLAAAWELMSFFLGMPSAAAAVAHPALSDIVGPLVDWAPTRAICVGLWLLGGYALLRRGRAS